MAYPTVSAPYGFRPVNRIDGLPYAGATKLHTISSSYNTPIYYGDVVRISAGGNIEKSTVTTDSTTAAANYTYGVFMGCQYVNSMSQTVQAQYYPGNSGVSNAKAYVVVDPSAEFKVAVTAAGVVTATTLAAIGCNCAVVQGSGSATTGDSGQSVAITAGVGSAAALPMRVVEVVYDTATGANAFVEVIVKINNPQIATAALAYNFA